MEIEVISLADNLTVVEKRALTDEAAARLAVEIRALERCYLPGIVRLVGHGATDRVHWMRTQFAGASSLASEGLAPLSRLALIADAHRCIATLHENLWAHGALRPSHLIVNSARRVSICSMGSATFPATDAAIAEDREQLANMLDDAILAVHEPLRARLLTISARVRTAESPLWECARDLDEMVRDAEDADNRSRPSPRLAGRRPRAGRGRRALGHRALGHGALGHRALGHRSRNRPEARRSSHRRSATPNGRLRMLDRLEPRAVAVGTAGGLASIIAAIVLISGGRAWPTPAADRETPAADRGGGSTSRGPASSESGNRTSLPLATETDISTTTSALRAPPQPPSTSAIGRGGRCRQFPEGHHVTDPDGGCPQELAIEGATIRIGDQSYSLGSPGDLGVLGDFNCDGDDDLALLRPATGEIFFFRHLGERSALTARSAAARPQATSISAVEGTPCDVIVTSDASGSGSPLPLDGAVATSSTSTPP
jgi:tRNA A-37 threonylcarbamoyl transferase component Bud32